jgi:ABC-type uncharacterized transport system substrate-binding protein
MDLSLVEVLSGLRMRKRKVFAMVIVLLAGVFASVNVSAADKGEFSTNPVTNNGKKWRIGYLEGGNYPDYEIILKATVKGLIGLGWIEDMEFPKAYNPNHREFWEWLSRSVRSDYLEFVPDAFWTSDFNKEVRPSTRAKVLERLKDKKDIDLMIAMGTWAGQDLANNDHSVPTVVGSCSNPISSNIIRSVEDSGYDHIHAKADPTRYERQVRLFHDIMHFSRLGVAFEDSVEGRTFAGIDSIEKVAKERGFEIVRCIAPFNNVSLQEAEKAVVTCHKELAPKIDALYITVHRGVNLKNMPVLLEPLIEHKIPTFSMLGSEEVKHGVLLSIAQAEFKYVGQFHAEVIAKILNGARARDIDQNWSDPLKIALNLKTAKLIQYDPPFDVMAAADEIYEDIEVAK